jgi:cobalamin synthase
MDALFNAVLERLGSKRAILGVLVIWLLKDFAEKDAENAVYYAGMMVVIAAIFVIEEFFEKFKGLNGDKK